MQWSGQYKAIKPNDLIETFYEINPELKGYGFKDAFEFFKTFVHTMHEEFKFFNLKIFDMKIVLEGPSSE